MFIKRWLLCLLVTFGVVFSSHWIASKDLEVTSRHQHGITNDGNTCYVASLVQLLFNVFHFRDAVLQHNGANHNDVLLALQIAFARIKYDFLDMMRHLDFPHPVNEEGDTFELLQWVLTKLPNDLTDLFLWRFKDSILIEDGAIALEEETSFFLTLHAGKKQNKRFEDIFNDELTSYVEGYIPNQTALKTTTLIQVPPIAIFRLVREEYSTARKKKSKSKAGTITVSTSSIDLPSTCSLDPKYEDPFLLSSAVRYGGNHYWANCRAEDDGWWSISDSSCRKVGSLVNSSRLKSDALMVTYVRKDISEAYSDRIPSILATISNVMDFIHENFSRQKSSGKFWCNIRALHRAAVGHAKDVFDNMIASIHENPRIFLNLCNYI